MEPSPEHEHSEPTTIEASHTQPKEPTTKTETIVQPPHPEEKYRTMLNHLSIAAAAAAILLLLLDKYQFLDTVLFILLFVPYPFWFSRTGVLVPFILSPPLWNKVEIILVLVLLHCISRMRIGRRDD